ncbi:MAG TPA: cation:proton antiporter [Kofleriaceae bacterium]|nr:cation:proton antiporter [Kofleriaceae bacterium]
MRRLFVIAAALGLMWALQAAQESAQGTAGMALAAIGFVVLASFTVGDLLNGIGLPRITGYIISGIVLGPEVIGVLSKPVVAKMGVFNTLALGLIALAAGLEIDLGAMRRVMRTMVAMTAAKVVLLLVIVGGGLYLTHLYILPLPVEDDPRALLLVVIIAVLGIGTSPSITLAMVNDTKARGRLTDLTLGLAVLKDVVVIIALAITIAVGHNAISPETSIGIAPVVLHMVQHLGLSIALGAVVGVLLILYVKYVHRELLLGAVCAVLITAEVSTYFDFELLLVLISAGFVVRNASEQEHHLAPALQRISLPVFVVFFTTAGAKVDLEATTSVLPFAGGAAVGRAIVYYLSARFGVWAGREGSAVRKNAWFGLLPQAGVTLGLVLLASHEVPELRDQILRIGLAMVAINLLVGPVLLGLALGRAGEIPGRARLATQPTLPVPVAAIAAIENAAPPRALPALTDRRLVTAHRDYIQQLDAWSTRLVEQVVAPLADRGKTTIVKVAGEHKQHDSTAAAVRTMLETASADPSTGLEAQLRAAHFEACTLAEALPERFDVITDLDLLRLSARDGVLTTLTKLGKRVAHLVRLRPKRNVPVRLAARASSDERLADALARIVPTWFEARGDMLDELARLVNAERDIETVKQAVVRRAAQFMQQVTTELRGTIEAIAAELQYQLATLGGPSAPPARLRLFELEERVTRTLDSLDQVADRGREVLKASMTTLHADALHAYVTDALDDELEGMVHRPLAMVADDIAPIVRDVMERLPATEDWSDLQTLDGADPIAFLAEVLDNALDERAAAQLRGLQMKYYQATQEAKLLARLAGKLEGLPAKLVVVDRHASTAGTLLSLEPARRLEEALLEDFAPDLLASIRPLGDLVSSLDARVNRALYVASRGITSALASSESRGARLEAAREPVTRARALLAVLLDELTATGASTRDTALHVATEARDRVAVALGKTSPAAAKPHPGRRRRRWWGRLVDRVARRASRWRERGETFVRALLRRPAVTEWIIRTGQTRLDAVAMREYVTRHHAPVEQLALPEAYTELVSPAPIDDIRLASARRAQLDALVEVLQPGNHEDFTSVLICGERGSGRTSLINVLGHRLARRRVIRLDARYHDRAAGPLAAMAAELGASVEPGELASALRRSPSIVLLDDLERFLRPSAPGIEDLDRFLRLVRATSSHTHWVVTAQPATVELVDPFVHLSETFGRRIDLAPVGDDELDRVIQARIQFSGLDIRCVDGSRRTRLRPKEAHRRYLRTLNALARGNLRRAVLLHARSITRDGDAGLVALAPSAPGLPFLRHLGAGPLAALSLLARCIELGTDDLADALGVPAADVDRYVLPLRSAGLVDSAAAGSALAIPPHLVDAVCTSLADLGLRPGGRA